MARYAVLNSNNTVINIIIAEDKSSAETFTGLSCLESDVANIGDSWNGSEFTIPESERPEDEVIASGPISK